MGHLYDAVWNFSHGLCDWVWNFGHAALPIAASITVWIWRKLNGNFSAALFGALAGAWGAHRIALSKERKDRLNSSIEATNTAIGLTNTIANNFIAVKRQHLADMLARYEQQFRELGQVELNAMQGHGPVVFTLLADFRTLSVPNTPDLGLLVDIIAQKVGPAVQVGSISRSLQQAVVSFYQSLARRHNLIAMMSNMDEETKALVYYGLRTQGGIDENYPDVLLALKMQCDDVIYFSMLLGEQLMKHGRQLPDLLARHKPKVVTLAYDNLPAGVLPDRSEYTDFERQYRAPPSPSTKRKSLLDDIKEKLASISRAR